MNGDPPPCPLRARAKSGSHDNALFVATSGATMHPVGADIQDSRQGDAGGNTTPPPPYRALSTRGGVRSGQLANAVPVEVACQALK